jgi:hypothetical protein
LGGFNPAQLKLSCNINMSLKYGLNVKKKAPVPTRRTLLDDEDGDDDDEALQSGVAEVEIDEISSFGGGRPAPSKAPPHQKPKAKTKDPSSKKLAEDDGSRQDLSALQAAKAAVKAAEETDSSIFDYDSFHDAKTSVSQAKQAAAKQDAIERKPKYINNLLDAAARRKQDQQIAREKFLQKEREAEGDEFADKEKFVTSAYKAQQEETRKLEEAEKAKQEEEERRKRQQGGGMQGFYRSMIDLQEQQHRATIEAAEQAEKAGVQSRDPEEHPKTEAELAAEMHARGVTVHVNDDGQIVDKRELLSAGLNLAPAGHSGDPAAAADHLKASHRRAESAFPARHRDAQQATRERQSRMMEEQLAERAKRQREEDAEERKLREQSAKSAKTEADISDARARFLARKAARERGDA